MIVFLNDPQNVPNFSARSSNFPVFCVANAFKLPIHHLKFGLLNSKSGIIWGPRGPGFISAAIYQNKCTAQCATLEIYCDHCDILALPVWSPHMKKHIDLLLLLEGVQIRATKLLLSTSAIEKWNSLSPEEMIGPQLRYLTVNCSEENIEKLKSIGPGELEERSDELGNKHRFFSGSGYIKDLIGLCDIPLVSLFIFVDEGDNSIDAQTLLNYFNAWKKLLPTQKVCWKVPFSWKNMFGAPAPLSIY
ncbi:unnamed protein product, partial [Meganyctiphanes norvegica]